LDDFEFDRKLIFLIFWNFFKNACFLIGLLPPKKYMDFIFFPERTLKKLLKSKFSEF
jgi:hypothetical protein